TLAEYLLDYGDEELQAKGFELINREIDSIERDDIRSIARKTQDDIKQGKRDIFL
ncbi:MAG: [FeFe] hydrogenase H-cluster radical SAM maturase HydG, partial [Clostridiaceae bacterium]|nr:[FeFe] hydrogenase H-cluster radical SAM maturase HydG [Clostridiaceae bacterium]